MVGHFAAIEATMYKEILLDHTSMHAMRPFQQGTDQLAVRANELLQLIEHLLLADVVWICDTVTRKTMSETLVYYKEFIRHGLANPRSDGGIRIAHFTPEQIRGAAKSASALIRDTITRYDANDLLRLSGTSAYGTRPTGAQPFDFHSLAAIEFGSQQAEDYIQDGLQELGWKTAALAPLLNSSLHFWLRGLVANIPDPVSPVYTTINTVFRWRYNEQLALLLSKPEGCGVDYVPAIGRARSIEYFTETSWAAKLRRLEQESTQAIENRGELLKMFDGLGPTFDYPLPLFGTWVVSQLKPGCTLSDLIEKIAELRYSSEVISVKQWLLEADTSSINSFGNDLRERLGKLFASTDSAASTKLLKMPNPLVWSCGSEVEISREMSPETLKKVQVELGPEYAVSTILSSMANDSHVVPGHIVLARVSDLLESCDDNNPSTRQVNLPITSSQTPDSAKTFLFRPSGDGWDIRSSVAGVNVHFVDEYGFGYLHQLLKNPNTRLSGTYLKGGTPVIPMMIDTPDQKRDRVEGLAAVKKKLEEVRANRLAISQAPTSDFLGGLTEKETKLNNVDKEIKQYVDYIATTTINPDTDAELQRDAHAVKQCLKRARKKLAKKCKEVADELKPCEKQIDFGFAYEPDANSPKWDLGE